MSLPSTTRPPNWQPDSWRQFPALQQPAYPDPVALDRVLGELRQLPPLVVSWEIVQLREQLAEAAAGKRFVLQGGDCAERFVDCKPQRITNMLKLLLQMSLVLVVGAKKPVIRIGRFAGQYAKPRSTNEETRDGVSLPSYRGDIVNRPEFALEARTPDPDLLLRGYERAALTLNFARALIKGGFADLHHPEYFDLDWAQNSPLSGEYRRIMETIGDSLSFMENILGIRAGETDRIDFFTAHEALHLGYESAQTRPVPRRPGYFNLSTHFPWAGLRTNQPGGAHIEYLRGIENPIGIKVGEATTRDDIAQWLNVLDPQRSPGRLTLIHRLGQKRIADALPRLIEDVRAEGGKPVWICDAMHGNTQTTSTGVKTRNFDDIYREVEQAFDIHRAMGQELGGVHIELTGENVTECIGGARGTGESDLGRAYESEVDPRLNGEQSIELAFLIARKMKSSAVSQ
ncbi:MAG TPA: 3-deoxy-7-phosphoheptulonate synthase class II [Candidatus Sulfopaludibacter sp.]|jgi:3-deoxy-7-phosphoheptulonate synthase|nr:3-deoxy-7-phosphoheptulonate synthase class II [Candidatus Sulfopaludibacter sp.]